MRQKLFSPPLCQQIILQKCLPAFPPIRPRSPSQSVDYHLPTPILIYSNTLILLTFSVSSVSRLPSYVLHFCTYFYRHGFVRILRTLIFTQNLPSFGAKIRVSRKPSSQEQMNVTVLFSRPSGETQFFKEIFPENLLCFLDPGPAIWFADTTRGKTLHSSIVVKRPDW